ncbi:hypothetical protein LY76DRAFT_163772 [Colletotrichum caudatum]|nr:hypothetical protein LY76DRAFT_163772 [Colletotrichum caudatum]
MDGPRTASRRTWSKYATPRFSTYHASDFPLRPSTSPASIPVTSSGSTALAQEGRRWRPRSRCNPRCLFIVCPLRSTGAERAMRAWSGPAYSIIAREIIRHRTSIGTWWWWQGRRQTSADLTGRAGMRTRVGMTIVPMPPAGCQQKRHTS